MIDLHQFSTFAARRGEGLHPKLRALLERVAVSPFSDMAIRHDGLIQAGPNPDSEIIPSRVDVALFSCERARPLVIAPEPDMRRLSAVGPKRDRVG